MRLSHNKDVKKVITRVSLTKKNTKSLRTVIPVSIVKKLKLDNLDSIEWLDISGQVVIKKL